MIMQTFTYIKCSSVVVVLLCWCSAYACVARLNSVQNASSGHRKRIVRFYDKLWKLDLLHYTLTRRNTTRLFSLVRRIILCWILMRFHLYPCSSFCGAWPQKFSSPIDLKCDLYNSWSSTELRCDIFFIMYDAPRVMKNRTRDVKIISFRLSVAKNWFF